MSFAPDDAQIYWQGRRNVCITHMTNSRTTDHTHGDDERIVLVDIDGTVANFEESVADGVYERSAGKWFIPAEERVSRRIADDYQARFGQEAADLVRSVMMGQYFFQELLLIEGAVEGVAELSKRGWNIVFLTTPLTNSPTCGDDKRAWVTRYFGESHARRMVLAKDKTLVRGRYLIDDRTQYGMLNPTWDHIMFGTSAAADAHGGLRAATWDEVLRLAELQDPYADLR